MRRGFFAGIVLGSLIGVYYGMSMNGKDRRRLRHMASDAMDRGTDMVDMVKDRAQRLVEHII